MDQRTLRVLEFDKMVKSLVKLAESDPGKKLASEINIETNFEKVLALLKETNDAESLVKRRGSPPLSGIHDISVYFKRVELGSALSAYQLIEVADVLMATRNMKNFCGNKDAESENIIVTMCQSLVPNKPVEDRIRQCIISEDEIADNASSALYSIRKKIRDTQNSIKDKLNDLIKSTRYQKFMQDPIVTMRGDRYCIPIKQEHRGDVPGLVHDASSSGATLFIEPMSVVEANNGIKELRSKEQAEIERIMYELSAMVAEISESLNLDFNLLKKLDFIFARAKLGIQYNGICPKLNKEHRINIRKGRHPLLDSKDVVPIDIWIGEDFKTLVVTGPNTGGKTVTLKTVGLFTLLTQAGINIPANEGTEMTVFEDVFADIGDEQSIEQSLSTFSSHMKNIVDILKRANDTSLVLFDELGAGTDPTEGAALAMSILECLHQTDTITLATTHYSELKVFAITTKGVENASCEFDVETLRPTYRLLIGIPGKSNAFSISKRLGLTDNIIDRAKEFLTQEDINFEDMMASIEKNRRLSEEERAKAERYRLEAQTFKQQLEQQKKKLEEQKEQFLKDSREKARKIVIEARQDAEEIIAHMKKLEAETANDERNRAAEEFRAKLKGKQGELEEKLSENVLKNQGFVKPPKNLKPGDTVIIINLNQKGTVLNVSGKDEALVQAGIMKINVKLTNLKVVDEQKKIIERYSSNNIRVDKSKSISLEVDIRGMLLDQAIDVVDKYLDDAAISGLHEVTIFHGKGTGALRAGLQQFMKNHGHIQSFRLGRFGEGETGVTVVELK